MLNVINVAAYGALGDGIHNDTDAFVAACAALNAQKGGTLFIPPGVYIVGKQTLAGQTGQGYAWRAADIIKITACTQPVMIEGNGAVLRAEAGLKFGSFDPVTGEPLSVSLPYTNVDSRANAYRMIQLIDNACGVVVKDLELDGNLDNLTLGGYWGQNAYELDATGVYASGNRDLLLENLHSHHHGLDGVYLVQAGLNAESTRRSVAMVNVNSEYNARQGLHLTGGNGITAIDCRFNHSGRHRFATAPACGVAIAPLANTLVCNGMFINCEMINTVGPCFFTSNEQARDIFLQSCTLIGTNSYAAWPCSPRTHFSDCTLSGVVAYPYSDSATSKGLATQFTRCRFTDALTYQGQVYTHADWFLLNFGNGSTGVKLTDCSIEAVTAKLGFTNGLITMTNCRMKQVNNTGAANLQAIFVGDNVLETSGSNVLTSSIVLGRLKINGEDAVRYDSLVLWSRAWNAADGRDQLTAYQSNPNWFTYPDVNQLSINQGDLLYNTQPAVGRYVGWLCVQGGTATTSVWKGFGQIVN